MMMQQQPQKPQQRRNKRSRLAAAFALASRGQSLEDQSAFVPEDICMNSNKQPCEMPQQEQDNKANSNNDNTNCFVQPDLAEKQQQQHEAITFLEEHGVPTFVPVFEDVSSIQPKCNQSLRGQVPWKCAFCQAHSFGHNCMSCMRHRDAAALRIFVGQLAKEGTQDVVAKMVEVLCPNLSAPTIFVEPHTDSKTGNGKGCAWIYVHTLEDIPYVVKCLNKRTFVTVDENSGNVGFVAFPPHFSNQEIEEAFMLDHEAQTPELQSLFLFTCIAAQVPKAFHSWGLLGNKKNNNKNKMMMNNNHTNNNNNNVSLPPPPPPTYGFSLPPPPVFSPQQQQNQQVVYDNRQVEEQQQYQHQYCNCRNNNQQSNMMMMAPINPIKKINHQQQQQQQQQNPTAFLGQTPSPVHFSCPVPTQPKAPASWVAGKEFGTEDDGDNCFVPTTTSNNQQ